MAPLFPKQRGFFDCLALFRAAFLLGALLLAPGCGSDKHSSPADRTPPASVTDLAVESVTVSTATLSWTAPGDDGSVGQASSYDLRYTTAPPDSFDWETATQALGEPAPGASGTQQTVTIHGLAPDTTYTFGVTASDDWVNRSGISNLVQGRTTASPYHCTVEPLTLGFGSVLAGTPVERTFRITNRGTATMTGNVSADCEGFEITSGAGPYTLDTGEFLDVSVRFQPSTPGVYTCTVGIGSDFCADVVAAGQATPTAAP